jgi:hypothetical protein
MYVDEKIIPVETIPGIGQWGRGIKESSGRSEFKGVRFDTL